MATKRKLKTFAMYDEDIEALKKIVGETQMNASEVVRYLIQKCASDPVEMQIIMQNFINTESLRAGLRKRLRIMSDKKAQIRKRAIAQRIAQSDQEKSVSNTDRFNFNKCYQACLDLVGVHGWPGARKACVDMMKTIKCSDGFIFQVMNYLEKEIHAIRSTNYQEFEI